MGQTVTQLIRRTFQPAAVGTDETTALFALKTGQRVLWAVAKPLTNAAASTTSTVTLGDGGDVDGYVSTTDLDVETATTGVLVGGTGAYLASSGGKLYTANDTVDAVYTANGATGAKPKVEFEIAVVDDWPS